MMKTRLGAAAEQKRTLRKLIEVVEALERRVPRPHARGEEQIASDSARLRTLARTRIGEMCAASRRRDATDAATANAVMTDDGGPVPA